MSIFDQIRKVDYFSYEEIEPIFGESIIYRIHIDGVIFEIFASLKLNSPYLDVYGQSAFDITKFQLPVFHRWSWAVKSPFSVIVLNDPTLYLIKDRQESYCAGWFQGTAENYYLPIACEIVSTFAKKLQIDSTSVLFVGSSAGGFTSLMMAAYIQGSSAFVVNPQTNLTCYPPFSKQILKNNFSQFSIEEAKDKFITRFSIVAYCRDIKYIPNFYYIQNLNDHHFRSHLIPFCGEINQLIQENKKLQPRIHYEIYPDQVGHVILDSDIEIHRIDLARQILLPKASKSISLSYSIDKTLIYKDSTNLFEYKKYEELTNEAKWVIFPIEANKKYAIRGQIASKHYPSYNNALVQFKFLDKNRNVLKPPYKGIFQSTAIGPYQYIAINSEKLSTFITNFSSFKFASYVELGFRSWYNLEPIIIASTIELYSLE